MIESTLKIARYCPLVIQGFSNFFRVVSRDYGKARPMIEIMLQTLYHVSPLFQVWIGNSSDMAHYVHKRFGENSVV